ncbi:MAG: ATP-binding protein [Gemmatimonadetes bacterium]|nr:ATP-binding protein [Gemmatimonadota bacterium]
MRRYLEAQVRADLADKMVLLGGPRQVGKTTLAKGLLADSSGYLSWDIPAHRDRILRRELPDAELWVFDEIHKYRRWRNYLKGVYDEFGATHRILVTGSARLDLYRFGGDSLQGRYHFLRLHPLSFAELRAQGTADVESLLTLGGFPEPFLRGSATAARRWSVEYRSRLIREEVTSLESVRDLGAMEQLMLALPDRVGSPLSRNSLREDLQLNHETVTRWLDIFERLYAIFRVAPFGAPRLRAVKKEQKHYHTDWSVVPEEGPRFENLVASHLLKWVHFQLDSVGRELELRYFRDVDGREVDFVVVERRKPVMMIEVKLAAESATPSLRYLKRRFPDCDAYQIHLRGARESVTDDQVRLWSAARFLSTLV